VVQLNQGFKKVFSAALSLMAKTIKMKEDPESAFASVPEIAQARQLALGSW